MPTIRTRASKGSALTHNEVDANFKRTARQVTATGSILVSDNRGTVEGNHATVAITLTLPTVAAAGAAEPGDFIVRVTNINAAIVSVDGSTTETINGSTDAITLGQWESATFELDSTGAGWVTTSRVGDLGAVNGTFTGNLTGDVTGNVTGNVTGDLTGNAATFTATANNATNETVYPVFVDGATGNQGAETDTGLTYNPSTGVLTSTSFAGDLTGDVTGNADTVTTNANLTGAVTSVGNATSLGSFSSANLRGALTDETGTGAAVFATSPTLVTPNLGTPSALVGTNITGTASGLTAGNVTTNANLTGDVTSVGNATTLTVAAITGQTDIGANFADTDEIIINDGGNIRRSDVSRFRDYVLGVGGHLYGLGTSNGTDAAHDIDVAAGSCAAQNGDAFMELTSTLTKQIDSDWAEGSGAFGGLATGARSVTGVPNASTWYHFFLISKTDGTVDGGWDTSVTATNLLADASAYTYYRRIASHFVDGSNDITAYTQIGDHFYWNAVVTELNTTSAATSETALTLQTPLGINTKAVLSAVMTDATTGHYGRFYPTFVADATPSQFNSQVYNKASSNPDGSSEMIIMTDTSSQINYRVLNAGADLYCGLHAYIDTRGK